MLEKLFNKEKFSIKNLLFMAIYIIVSFFIYVYFEVTKNPQKSILIFYTFLTHFYLIAFDYRAIRKIKYFCFWLLVGIVHFVIYLKINENTTYAFVNGTAANGFRTTLLLLLFFQFVRLLSFEVQGVDYVLPQRHSRMDMFEEREYTNWDHLFTFLLLAFTIIFNFI